VAEGSLCEVPHLGAHVVPAVFADGSEHARVGVGPPGVLGTRQLRQILGGADRPGCERVGSPLLDVWDVHSTCRATAIGSVC
jgi:hypothetical protein